MAAVENDPAISAHLKAFNDHREGVRSFAVRKMAERGTAVVPLLIRLLAEKKGFTQDCAAEALCRMGNTAIPFVLEAMQSHPDHNVRMQAAAVLAAMGEPAHQAVRDSQRYINLTQDAPS
jgi:HEAT repeat protein